MSHTDAEVAFAAVAPVGSAEAHMSMTAEQQIRAKALECATRYHASDLDVKREQFWKTVDNLERYIREGK